MEGQIPREAQVFLRKAAENLADCQAAFDAGRYNGCARSSYYAAFHAAVAALRVEGIYPATEASGTLSHKMVQAEWATRLVNRRNLYPPEQRHALPDLMGVRLRADYEAADVSIRQARRGVSDAVRLVHAVEARLASRP